MPNHRILRFVFLLLSAILMLWSAPAVAEVTSADDPLNNFEVICHPGEFVLTQATGMPADKEHHFTLTGSCTLQANYLDGPQVIANPSVVITSGWYGYDNRYVERVTIKDGRTLTLPFARKLKNGLQVTIHLDGYREAEFECSANPLSSVHPQCKVLGDTDDATDWHPPWDMDPILAQWGSNPAQPMVVGLTTPVELKAMYGSNQVTASRCDNLHLASQASNGKTKTYTFTGTCQLYHTKDGSGGLKPTKVKVTATWDPDAQAGLEVVQVLTSIAKGGGSWGWIHKCYYNPWITPWNKNVCILNRRQDNNPPPAVYKPITDIMRVPLASGLASHLAVAKSGPNMKRSRQPRPLRLRQGTMPNTRYPATSSGHINSKLMAGNTPGRHTASANPGSMQARPTLKMAAPKMLIVGAVPHVDQSCKDTHKLIVFDVTVRNNSGRQPRFRQWRLTAREGEGAALNGSAYVPTTLAPGAETIVSVPVSENIAYIHNTGYKLPGTHWLKLDSFDNFARPPDPRIFTTTLPPVTLPQGICQPTMHMRSPAGMRMQPRQHINTPPSPKLNPQPEPPSAVHRLSLPAVQ